MARDPHETLIDFLYGELPPREAEAFRQRLESDSDLRKRAQSLQTLRNAVRSIPEFKPSNELQARMAAAIAAERIASQPTELDGPTSRLLVEATSLDHEELRVELEQRLRQEFRSFQDEEAPAEIGLLVDFHRGELSADLMRGVGGMIRDDALFAAISRAVQRTLRLLAPFSIEPTQELRKRVFDVLEQGKAEALREPSPALRDLIDLHRRELGEGEESRLRQSMSRSPGMVADQAALEDVWSRLSALPTVEPSTNLAARIDTALRKEAASSPLAFGRDALRGELPGEYAEAFAGDERAASQFLSAFAELPEAGVDGLAARMAEAIRAESTRRPSSESDRIRLRRALPAILSSSKVPQTLPKPRKLSIKRRGKRVVRSRGVVLALWLHAVLLSLAWMTVVNLPTSHASPLSLDLGWASHDVEISEETNVADKSASPSKDVVQGSEKELRPNQIPFGAGAFVPDVNTDPALVDARPYESLSDVVSREFTENPAPVDVPAAATAAMRGTTQSVGSGVWFQLRNADMIKKAELYTRFAGSMELLKYMDEMLSALVRSQRPDGSWGYSSDDDFRDVRDVDWRQKSRQVETTSLSLLALLGNGYALARGPVNYRKAVKRGTDWLVALQNARGGFIAVEREGELVSVDTVQADAIAAYALVEAFRAPGGRALRVPMIRALDRVLSSQIIEGKDTGAWRIGSSGEADMVATAWAVQALKTARETGWADGRCQPALKACALWLNSRVVSRDTVVPDRELGLVPIFTREAISGQTAERALASGTSASMLLGRLLEEQGASVEQLEAQLKFLSRPGYLPDYREERSVLTSRYNTNLTAWYFASLDCWQLGVESEAEEGYLTALYQTCFGEESRAYTREGVNAGTLAPHGELEERMGRIYCTAMGALCIENAYRTRFVR